MMQQNPLLKEYLDLAFRRRWWIIIPTICGLLFSIALYFKMPQKFKASTRVTLRPQTISKKLLESTLEENPVAGINRISAEITSEVYMRELQERVPLIGTPGGPADLQELARAINASIDLEVNERRRFFDLSVVWGDRRLAANIANELAAIYIRASKEDRQTKTRKTLEQLTADREDIERQLDEINKQVEEFQSKHRYALGSYQTTNEQFLERNNNEIQQIDREVEAARHEIKNLQLNLSAGSTSALPVEEDPRLTELTQRRAELEAARDENKTDEHPDVIMLKRRIASLEKQLGAESGGDTPLISPQELNRRRQLLEIQRLENEIEENRAKRAQLVEQNEKITDQLLMTPENDIILEAYQRKQERLTDLYREAQEKVQDAAEGAALEQLDGSEKLVVLNFARPPKEPFWPDLRLFLFMGFAVGSGLGVGLVLLLEVFDQSFKSEEQLAAAIDLPILAVVPDLNHAIDRTARKGKGRPSNSGSSGTKSSGKRASA